MTSPSRTSFLKARPAPQVDSAELSPKDKVPTINTGHIQRTYLYHLQGASIHPRSRKARHMKTPPTTPSTNPNMPHKSMCRRALLITLPKPFIAPQPKSSSCSPVELSAAPKVPHKNRTAIKTSNRYIIYLIFKFFVTFLTQGILDRVRGRRIPLCEPDCL